jgi:anthranilate phosphoribosyltransferase
MIEALKLLIKNCAMNSEEAQDIMSSIIDGRAGPEQVGAFLMGLHFNPPNGAMLAGFVRALKKHAQLVSLPPQISDHAIDVCGTGGDGLGTFNISTAVSFVTAAAGQPVVKHGNRSVSSRCGSFDVLEALSIPFSNTPEDAIECLTRFNVAFLYAPSFHPVLRRLAQVRKQMGVRTIFNALGPLLNPASIRRQLIGVYSANLVLPLAEALREMQADRAMIVHGDDGGDELSLCAPTTVAHLQHGSIHVSKVTPEQFGFQEAKPRDLRGGNAQENADILKRIFDGEKGPRRDVVVWNTAAALFVGGKTHDLHAGIRLAQETLDSGRVHKLFQNLTNQTRNRENP